MDKIKELAATSETFLNRMKSLESLFATTPKHEIKATLGMKEYERIVAILEYVHIKTTWLADALKADITVDLFEEQNSFFFTLKQDNKLKKQKIANEHIDEILEIAEVFGVDINRDSVISVTEAKDSEEIISTNKVLAKARNQLSNTTYLKLRDKFVEEGWIILEETKSINLEEETLKTLGNLVKQAIEMGKRLTEEERLDLVQFAKDEIVRIKQEQAQ